MKVFIQLAGDCNGVYVKKGQPVLMSMNSMGEPATLHLITVLWQNVVGKATKMCASLLLRRGRKRKRIILTTQKIFEKSHKNIVLNG